MIRPPSARHAHPSPARESAEDSSSNAVRLRVKAIVEFQQLAVASFDDDGRLLDSATGPGLAIISEPGGRESLTRSLTTTLELVGVIDGSFETGVFGLNGEHAPRRRRTQRLTCWAA